MESPRLRSARCGVKVRNGLTLRLAYTAEVAADVCQMVEQERVCCPFLTFDANGEVAPKSDLALCALHSVPPGRRSMTDFSLRGERDRPRW